MNTLDEQRWDRARKIAADANMADPNRKHRPRYLSGAFDHTHGVRTAYRALVEGNWQPPVIADHGDVAALARQVNFQMKRVGEVERELAVALTERNAARTELKDYRDEYIKQCDENVALRGFKAYVHKRLDDAGVPTHPEGEHSAAGCRVGDRLDLALAGYAKPVDPDLLAARQLSYAALLDFAKKAKYPHNATRRYARAEATRRGDHDSGPLVQDMLRAFKAGKAAK